MSNSMFFRFFFGPLITLGTLIWIHVSLLYLPPGSSTVAFTFIPLVLGAILGGLRASLFSALLVTVYSAYFTEYNPWRLIAVSVSAFAVAGVISWGKRRLVKQALENERLQIKLEMEHAKIEIAEATLPNGNRARIRVVNNLLVDLLKDFDKLSPDAVLKSIRRAQYQLANTLTLFDSWHEIAKEKMIAIEKLEKDFVDAHGYSHSVADTIREIHAFTREALARIYEIEQKVDK